MEINLAQVALSFFIAIVTAWGTVWLSLRRFYREKWWERKMNAYSAIIESLHHMKRDLEVTLDAEVEGREIAQPRREEMDKKYATARAELLKNVDMSEFLLCTEAASELRSFEKELDKASNEVTYYEHVEACLVAVSACLAKVRKIARSDLKG